jgi:NTE family protein
MTVRDGGRPARTEVGEREYEHPVSASISQLRQRLARESRTAFVLSGGGNQSVAQVGMLRALAERNIVPDVIVGCSAGAFNGATIAAHPDLSGIERLEATWGSLKGDEVFPGGRLSRAWNLLTRDDHLFSNQGLRAILLRGDTPATFEDLLIPLRVVAADLDTGDEVVFAHGPLEPALLASSALPGLFPPIRHDGRTLVDGAVVDTVPLWHALAGPVDRIYVMNVAGDLMDRPLRSPIDVAIRAFAISRKQRFDLELRNVPESVEVVMLPAPTDERELFDFSGGKELMDAAYRLAQDTLDAAEVAKHRRRALRRPWWRRDAG